MFLLLAIALLSTLSNADVYMLGRLGTSCSEVCGGLISKTCDMTKITSFNDAEDFKYSSIEQTSICKDIRNGDDIGNGDNLPFYNAQSETCYYNKDQGPGICTASSASFQRFCFCADVPNENCFDANFKAYGGCGNFEEMSNKTRQGDPRVFFKAVDGSGYSVEKCARECYLESRCGEFFLRDDDKRCYLASADCKIDGKKFEAYYLVLNTPRGECPSQFTSTTPVPILSPTSGPTPSPISPPKPITSTKEPTSSTTFSITKTTLLDETNATCSETTCCNLESKVQQNMSDTEDKIRTIQGAIRIWRILAGLALTGLLCMFCIICVLHVKHEGLEEKFEKYRQNSV